MKLIEIVQAKRAHIERFANQSGAAGELVAISEMEHWIQRPKGPVLKVLLAALQETGICIKGSSFDAISLPNASVVDFSSAAEVKAALPGMCFVEIKSASQSRVKAGFAGFFFALTESEIIAAEALGHATESLCTTNSQVSYNSRQYRISWREQNPQTGSCQYNSDALPRESHA